MVPRSALLLAAISLVLAGCVSPGEPVAIQVAPPALEAPFAFTAPIPVGDDEESSEPMIALDSEGRIFISAPTGVPSTSPLFVSEDGGVSWKKLAPNPDVGPRGFGGGDTSIAIGPDDSIWITDLWAGNSAMLVSKDHGASWQFSPVSSVIPYHDREWNAVDAKGVGYYLARVFTPGIAAHVSKSTDGGRTWLQAGVAWAHGLPGDANRGIQDGNLIVNPKTDALGVVYSCAPGICISTSSDGASTWKPVVVHTTTAQTRFIFPAIAADRDGNWYVAWGERASGEKSNSIKLSRSADGIEWSEPLVVSDAKGLKMFPWLVAGDAGRIGLVWYGTDREGDNNDLEAMKDAQWHIVYAQSLDALAPTPTFAVANITAEPVKRDTVSTQGFRPGPSADRDLGDFFSIALGPDGMAHIASVVKPTADSKPAVHYFKQTAGASLFATNATPLALENATAEGSALRLPPLAFR